MVDINWHNIRPINGRKEDGFEEFIAQIARKDMASEKGTFFRNGRPDAGCEAYFVHENGCESGWQAKYFTNSLGTTQFNQIKKSIETAVRTHPKITKYYIAIPMDPPDPRVLKRKSMRKKWDSFIVEEKQEYPNIEFITWFSSDLITKLQLPQYANFLKFWFDKEFFAESWLQDKNEQSIKDLGPRYSPELNIELDINEIFDALAKNDAFLERYKKCLSHFLQETPNLKEMPKTIEGIADNLFNQAQSLRPTAAKFDLEKILKTIETINKLISQIYEKAREITDEKEHRNFRDKFNKIFDKFLLLKNFVSAQSSRLYLSPFLMLLGGPGVGKSHLFADIVSKREKNSEPSVLLLGQKFSEDKNPRNQIIDQLGLGCTFSEFLEAAECTALIKQKRFIIFIDAINEGKGKCFWQNHLNGFVTEIKKYPNIGLAMSLRTTYQEIFKNNLQYFALCTHHGFKHVTPQAVKKFFAYYKIGPFNILNIYSEFENPLFLKLYCEGIKHSGNKNLTKIEDIFSFFIDAVNYKLLQERASSNLVKKAINILIDYQIDNLDYRVPYYKAEELLYPLQKLYCNDSSLLENMISEGLLIKDAHYTKEEFIDIAYEKLRDYLIAKRLIEIPPYALRKFFKIFLKSPYFYQGILESLAIQLPNDYGKEIFDFKILNFSIVEPFMCSAFLKSMLWRNWNIFNEKKVLVFINENILSSNFKEEFLNNLILLANNPQSYFNARRTHIYLMKFTMPDRDAWWIPYMNKSFSDEYSPLKDLLDWSFSLDDKSYLSDDVIELTAIMLSWFLASSNRELRDRTTRALVRLLLNRPYLVINLLKQFENVNDPYIYERVYAVTYGVALCSSQTDYLKELSEYIYRTIFDKEYVYSHVLLRDYARETIEYALHLGIKLDIDINKIRPPYTSIFPEIPSDDEIKQYEIDYKLAENDPSLYGVSHILSSMGIEYPREKLGTRIYGDFGRYIFQSAISHFIDKTKEKRDFIQDMANIAVKRVFELGYDAKKHGEYDNSATRYLYRQRHKNERIGKKYQRIALNELLAQLSDNYKIEDRTSVDGEKEIHFSGPWEPYVRDIDPSNLAIYYTPSIVENTEYDTNWIIDNKKWVHDKNDLPNPQKLLQSKDAQWVLLNGFYEWNEPKEIGEDKYSSPSKDLFYLVNSYFVNIEEAPQVISWLSQQNLGWRWLPEKHDAYELFNREYVWSPGFNFFSEKTFYSGEENTKLYNKEEIAGSTPNEDLARYLSVSFVSKDNRKETKKMLLPRIKKLKETEIGTIIFTNTNSYLYENETDESLLNQNHTNIKKPAKILFDQSKLCYGKYDNCLYTPSGELASFDNNGHLYFKKDILKKFLKANNLVLIWTVLGEKNITNTHAQDKKATFYRLTISGIYRCDRNFKINGGYKTLAKKS